MFWKKKISLQNPSENEIFVQPGIELLSLSRSLAIWH
jgi:hypothetical protein